MAVGRVPCGIADFPLVPPHPFLEFRRKRLVPGRHAVVRRSLKNGQVPGGLGDDRSSLDSGRTGADLADTLASEVNPLMRPLAGMVPCALEALQTGDVRHVGAGKAADSGDQKFGRVLLAPLDRKSTRLNSSH